MKNLIRGYLTAPERKKGEILKLIANILGMSDHETSQVTTNASHSVPDSTLCSVLSISATEEFVPNIN